MAQSEAKSITDSNLVLPMTGEVTSTLLCRVFLYKIGIKTALVSQGYRGAQMR